MRLTRPLLTALLAFLTACVSTPAKYNRPLQAYQPVKPVRIRVVGFEYERFRATGESHASSFGGVGGSGNVTGTGRLEGSGNGWQVRGDSQARGDWHTSGSWGSQAHAVEGEYVTETHAPEVAAAFVRTGCFQVVAPGAPADYVFEGRASGRKALGAGRRALSIIEAFTLTPLFGMPLWGKAEGESSINVYRAQDGTLVRDFYARVPVDFATTIYSFREDEPEAATAAKGYAIRDTIEQAAAAFCGRKLSPAARP